MKKDKILVILGPTASGKSDLAVNLAKQFNGEVISADSRQVYKGLDIGSGKITQEEMEGIPHYLLDVVKPQTVFTVSKFQKLAQEKIKDILKRGKLPIIAGGTGFYIQSIVDNTVFPKIKPDLKLRKHLEVQPPSKLWITLKELDPEKAQKIDPQNSRRLIRAIEIAQSQPLGGWTSKDSVDNSNKARWEALQIGIKTDRDILKERISRRFTARVKQGIVEEAKKLHEKGLTYERFSEIGLAYKYMVDYLKNTITKEEFIEESIKSEQRYAKRQMTWFKRDKRIEWFSLKDQNEIKDTVLSFLMQQEQV
ncbi:MAG: tRNA (adenosine(37)-N6)-dimethylallyltransferase MiaA [Patescibacteria group bacterium]|nr:tRNA (adenosine(37)-N6)-dimethylallyltransferase MiaA [Patescibacteria group bacterium]